MLSEMRLFHGIVRTASKDPCMGDGGVARWFIQVEIEAAAWVSSVPSLSVPLWRKSNGVFSKAKMKASVQFLFRIKAQCFGAPAICRGSW